MCALSNGYVANVLGWPLTSKNHPNFCILHCLSYLRSELTDVNLVDYYTTILWLPGLCLGQPGWTSTRRNIHPITLIVVIIIPYPLPPSFMIHGILPVQFTCQTVFFHNLSKPSLVYLLAWHPALHTPYISSPNHCLFFTAHSHIITTCLAVLPIVPKLCHLLLISLSALYL